MKLTQAKLVIFRIVKDHIRHSHMPSYGELDMRDSLRNAYPICTGVRPYKAVKQKRPREISQVPIHAKDVAEKIAPEEVQLCPQRLKDALVVFTNQYHYIFSGTRTNTYKHMP